MKLRIEAIQKALKRGGIKIKTVSKNNTQHILAQGDCLDVMRFMPDRSVDLIITDPPYNEDLNYGKKFDDSRHLGEYYSWLKRRLEDVPRVLKSTGSFYLMSYPEINARLLPFLQDELKLDYRSWITWHYPTNIGHSPRNFTRSQRSILFFTKSQKYTFNRNKTLQLYENPDVKKVRQLILKGKKGRGAYDFLTATDLIDIEMLRTKKTIFDSFYLDLLKNVSKDRLNKKHPCQLPPKLIELLIKVSSNKNDIVLDPFAGTFSTCTIAASVGRNSVGIEIRPKYIGLGTTRFKAH